MKFVHNLLCVKSIITVVLIVTLATLAIMNPDEYKATIENLTYIVVTFYFTHQTNKKGDNDNVGSWHIRT